MRAGRAEYFRRFERFGNEQGRSTASYWRGAPTPLRELFFRFRTNDTAAAPEAAGAVRTLLLGLRKFLIFIANSPNFATLLSLGSGIPMS